MENKILYIYVILLFLTSCKKSKEVGLFENGNIKYEVPLKNNLREGKMLEYFQNRQIRSISFWKQGKSNDTSTHFFLNGNIESISVFNMGKLKGESYLYYESGAIKEKHWYNNNGKLVDYYKYKESGTIDLDYRHPIFISDNDTLNYGESYKAKIRLGNRLFKRIKVNLINLSDYTDEMGLRYFGDTLTQLKNLDSLTVSLIFNPMKKGEDTVQGIIYDIYENGDTLRFHPIPFRHKIFVK